MGTLDFWNLSGLSDEHLLRDLGGVIASGARVEARVVAHLAEVEERRLHLKAAASSLFDYCRRRLGLSESEAFHRITAARLARKFPVIFGLLEVRSIHLSALRVLRDHLTSENHVELLAAASGKSKKEVEALVAELAPRPDVPPMIRKLPTKRLALPWLRGPLDALPSPSGPLDALPSPSGAALIAAPALESSSGPCSQRLAHDRALVSSAKASFSPSREPLSSPTPELALGETGERVGSAAPRAVSSTRARTLEPLSSSRYLLRLSVGREFKDKLERARDLMSHANPSGDLASVLERALDLLVEKLEKQRFARTQRPRPAGKVPLEPLRQDAEVVPERKLGAASGSARAKREPRRDDRVPNEPADARPSSPNDARPSSPNRPEGIEREAPGAMRTRREHIPNGVRRAVAMRDGEQCTYVDDEGRRCPSRAFLQVHHEQAHAFGGASTLGNLRLLCGSHNRMLAEQDFGRAHQARFTSRKQGCLLQAERAVLPPGSACAGPSAGGTE